MLITFFSNFINHHQVLVADELNTLTNGNFYFVEETPMYEWLRKSGYPDYSQRPYVIQAWKNLTNKHKAENLSLISDVAVFGGPEVLKYQIARAKTGKLSFEVSERWLKKGLLNILSPNLLKNMWYYHTLFFDKPIYKLCSSAFGANDQYLLSSYKERCYKWGYFTRVDNLDIESIISKRDHSVTSFMWCSRFIDWKHPELPIKLASYLKKNKIPFVLDMYGSGNRLNCIKQLVKKSSLQDVVRFFGNVPNNEILTQMQSHDVFLFTSDRNEGWGAVANEAMANGCLLIASDEIGSIPFLIQDKESGLIFKSGDINSLVNATLWYLNNPDAHNRIICSAYNNIQSIWSAENAARNFITLVNGLNSGKKNPINYGPCSEALPL